MRIFYSEKTIIKAYKIKVKIIIAILSLFLIFLLLLYYTSVILVPSLNEIADNKISYEMTRCINEAIVDVIEKENVSYSDIVKLNTNDAGDVKSVNGNTVLMNKLKSEISLEILRKTNEFDEIYIDFPLIQLFKNSLFRTGIIRVKIMCYVAQTLDLNFYNEFKSVGINQTNAIINVGVTMKYKIITPSSMFDTEIKTDVPIAYTIIVGNVPDSYVNVESDPNNIKDDVLQLATN